MASNVLQQLGGNNILLEAGANELEILVFRLGEQRFGVNVAKVREALSVGAIASDVSGEAAIEGVTQVRETVVSVINLHQCLFGTAPPHSDEDRLLLLEFNGELLAFRVQQVERIYRMSWQEIQPLVELPGANSPVTSVANIQGALVLMLDFESLGARFGLPCHRRCDEAAPQSAVGELTELPIIFVDDSPMIREMIADELKAAGFHRIRGFTDGEQAWTYLKQAAAEEGVAAGSFAAAVITDIEMPRMDGLTLTKRIREHDRLTDLPVVVFSSIASRDNAKKAEQVRATAQVSKPDYAKLTTTLIEALQAAR